MRLLVTGGAGFIGSHFVRYWCEKRLEESKAYFEAQYGE
ncbi:hypothetical protein LCGC14_1820990 [marine sediment metagenome]|uniref:NAD-dependent epimerase/dehydratase domain-containing protein n=1 Tax=marine sediment metagenome TaxID=412755 RepID=A0A0F9IYT1_9ZZZZ